MGCRRRRNRVPYAFVAVDSGMPAYTTVEKKAKEISVSNMTPPNTDDKKTTENMRKHHRDPQSSYIPIPIPIHCTYPLFVILASFTRLDPSVRGKGFAHVGIGFPVGGTKGLPVPTGPTGVDGSTDDSRLEGFCHGPALFHNGAEAGRGRRRFGTAVLGTLWSL
jgi:hypothetical protein